MRDYCPRCRWPKDHCWCHMLQPMKSATKFLILMHPHEVKRVKAGTGRFTALSFEDAEIRVGVEFDRDEGLQAMLSDPRYYPVLLYPGPTSRDISRGDVTREELGDRRLLVILLDATWALAKKMLKLSPSLQRLDRLTFSTEARSRFVIKQQPGELCLSTLEATHELMLALEKAGLDRYERPEQLLDAFMAMQQFQIDCAHDPTKASYRQGAYKEPSERRRTRQSKRAQSRLFFRDPSVTGPKSGV